MEINSVRFRETLHNIPFSEDSWVDLISLVKASTNSQAGIMMITQGQEYDVLNSYSPDFTLSQEVRRAFRQCAWMTATLPEKWSCSYLDKGVVLGTDLVSQEKMRATSFYQEILSTFGLEYLMAGMLSSSEDCQTRLKFFRTSKQGNFSRDEAKSLAMLMPEIRQMMRFAERLYERMVLETAAHKAGAPRDAATIIINTKGEIVQTNQAAENLLGSGKILSAKQNHLYAVNDPDSRALGKLMAKSLGISGTPAQDCALVGEASDAGTHQLLALPVPLEAPPFPWVEELKVAAIVLIDPMRKVKVDANILKALYRLTPAEIKLVNAMANGIKPVQYATLASKSVPTVQTQRQAVFQKTGVKNQLELMNTLRDLTTSF